MCPTWLNQLGAFRCVLGEPDAVVFILHKISTQVNVVPPCGVKTHRFQVTSKTGRRILNAVRYARHACCLKHAAVSCHGCHHVGIGIVRKEMPNSHRTNSTTTSFRVNDQSGYSPSCRWCPNTVCGHQNRYRLIIKVGKQVRLRTSRVLTAIVQVTESAFPVRFGIEIPELNSIKHPPPIQGRLWYQTALETPFHAQ